MSHEPSTIVETTILDIDTAWMVMACQQSQVHTESSPEKPAQPYEEKHA